MSEQIPPALPAADAPDWWQALTLQERLPGAPVAPTPDEPTQRRLQRWRAESPLLDETAFAEYLAHEGLATATLTGLLGESPMALQARQADPLPWLRDLYAAYQAPPAPLFPDAHLAQAGFLVLVEPLLIWAQEQLRQQLAQLGLGAGHPFTAAVAESALLTALQQQLPPLIERALVLEMHVARLQGELPGTSASERFVAFLQRLRDPVVALALFQEYPVLARQLVTKTQQTSAALVEVLTALRDDGQTLRYLFADGRKLGPVTEIALGVGDTHREGRSVAIIHFATGLRLVYKPRSLLVDVHFQSLLSWLNRQGAQPPFRTLAVLDREHYGWIEFVAAAPCTTEAELERFYQRQGGYLALLHLLSAADFHFENLIAAGEDPVLIDLEALFHPDVMEYDPNDPGQLAQAALDQSVLSIGMLPQRLRFHAEAATIDISGLGAAGAQLTPDKLPVWEGVGTDEMRLTRRHVAFRSDGHRPLLAGQEVDVRRYSGAVAAGFAATYRLLLSQRDALLAEAGPLARFAEAETRVVARATRTYSLLLQESSHPDLLRNALERDRLYTRLWRDVTTAPRLARLLRAERRDLHTGDVPIFATKPGTRHLWDSQGEAIPDFLAESGLDRVTRRVQALGEADLARQRWYIEAAFATLDAANTHRPTLAPAQRDTVITVQAHAEQGVTAAALAQAQAIGDQLTGLAHRHHTHAVWIGLGLDEQASWSLAPLTMHLYDGHAGVTFFFAYLGAVTGEDRYRTLAEAALTTTLVQADGLTNFSYIGGFSGWGGLIYTLAHLGSLWQRPDLWEKALTFVARAVAQVAQDEQFDIIGGAAGCIGAAAALYRCTQSTQVLSLIDQCAAHLVAHAQPMATGVGWIVPNMGGTPLAGFSHGAAGIAWALTTAADLCGNGYYRTVADQALAYERSLFDPQVENWLDLRSDGSEPATPEPQFMYAWCHGAPGIGLARLALLATNADPDLQGEVRAALRSTARAGFGHGHSLCHGDLGNLDLFLSAAQVWDDAQLRAEVDQLAQAMLAGDAAHGWRCGVPGGVETPGLMVGLAGIGYQLLRLAVPAHVPSVLMLEPPHI